MSLAFLEAVDAPDPPPHYAQVLLLGLAATSQRLATELLRDGVALVQAKSQAEAEQLLTSRQLCLALLEVDVRSRQGAATLRPFRRAGIPAIVLGAEADPLAQRLAFLLGAADFMATSEGAEYLAGRIRFFLAHEQFRGSQRLASGDLELDPTHPAVWVEGSSIELTASEYAALAALVKARGRTVSREQLVRQVRGHARALPLVRSIDAHVRALRRKLREGGGIDPIVPVRGRGYRLANEPVASRTSLTAQALEALAEPVLVLDAETRVCYANDAARACLGYQSAIEGRPCAGLVGCSTGNEKSRQCLAVAATTTGLKQSTRHCIRPKDAPLSVTETVSPLSNAPGYVVLQLHANGGSGLLP